MMNMYITHDTWCIMNMYIKHDMYLSSAFLSSEGAGLTRTMQCMCVLASDFLDVC